MDLLDEALLIADGPQGRVRQRDELVGSHLLGVEAQAGRTRAVGEERIEPKGAGVTGAQTGLGQHHDQVAIVGREALQVRLGLELGHHELGDEARQRAVPGGKLVEVDDRVDSDAAHPAIAAVLFEKDPQEHLGVRGTLEQDPALSVVVCSGG